MGRKFCPSCGAPLSATMKFCEQCGSPVGQEVPAPALRIVSQPGLPPVIPPGVPSPSEVKGNRQVTILLKIFIVLIIAAAAVVLLLPALTGSPLMPPLVTGHAAPAITTPIVATTITPSLVTTTVPPPAPDPFPGAMSLKQSFPFGTGRVASQATVYRYWINDTYEWRNMNKDDHYYVREPKPGNKYLFVFVQLVNTGDTRVWFPPAGNIIVHYDGTAYHEDPDHFKPENPKDEPIDIKEVGSFQKLSGDEFVEDFGYSHDLELAYLYPGEGNAVDGYIIYEVPQSLTPEKTYVDITFNGQDRGVWKLE